LFCLFFSVALSGLEPYFVPSAFLFLTSRVLFDFFCEMLLSFTGGTLTRVAFLSLACCAFPFHVLENRFLSATVSPASGVFIGDRLTPFVSEGPQLGLRPRWESLSSAGLLSKSTDGFFFLGFQGPFCLRSPLFFGALLASCRRGIVVIPYHSQSAWKIRVFFALWKFVFPLSFPSPFLNGLALPLCERR